MNSENVDAIEVTATAEGGRVRVRAQVGPELALIDSLLAMFEIGDLPVIARGVRARTGFGTDYAFVSYGEKTVDIAITEYSLEVPTAAFERLMARLFRAVFDAAANTSPPVQRAPWWESSTADADAVIARAYPPVG